MKLRARAWHSCRLIVLLSLCVFATAASAHLPHPADAPPHPIDSPEYHAVATDEHTSGATADAERSLLEALIAHIISIIEERLGTSFSLDSQAHDESDHSHPSSGTTVSYDSDEQPVCSDFVGTYESHIHDASDGNTLEQYVDISVSGDECVIVSDQIPDHDIAEGGSFASQAAEVRKTFRIPAAPTVASAITPVSGYAKQGAVMLNGVKWDSGPAACFGEGNESLGREKIGCNPNSFHPWRYEVGSPYNGFGVDDYNAHVQPDGAYHYHASPVAGYDADCSSETDRVLIGFAMDGFPIFGCYLDEDGEVRKAESSFALKDGEREAVAGYTTPYEVGGVRSDEYNGQFTGDYEYVAGLGDLDACNGAEVDGVYGYYVTDDYPYVLSCFTGTVTN